MKAENNVYLIQKELLKNSEVKIVFDIGAWVGNTAVEYSNYFPNSIVHTFEPFPESFEKLKKKSENFENRIIANQVAISDKVGQATFYSNLIETTNSLLPSTNTNSKHDYFRNNKKEIKVDTLTIDEYCTKNNINRINIVKMDIQGAELAAMQGATSMLEASKIDIIFCEVNFIAMYENSALFHELVIFLEKFGYRVHNLYGFNSDEHGQLAWGDAIFKSKNI